MIATGSDYVYLGDYNPYEGIANTNVFSVEFNLWHATYNEIPGEPIHCSDCKSILNSHSKIEAVQGRYEWVCEFCGNLNLLDISDERIPKSDSVDYLLEAPKSVTETGGEDITVVVCIDVSGSMYMPANGYFENQSRLDMVKAALWKQVQADAENHPNRKICIISFGSEVCIYKDPDNKLVIPNPSSMSFEDYLEYAFSLDQSYIGMPMADLDSLHRLIFSLKTKGQTALGPAVALGIGMAERGAMGSKVVVFTDGVANIGIGALEGKDSKDVDKTSFYNQAGMYARERGLNVNVIAIGGAECKISYLASLAEFTEGTLVKSDFEFLNDLVNDVLSARAVAFNVTAKARLHRALKFNYTEDISEYVQHLGNIVSSNLYSFRYQRKSSAELHISEIDINELTQIPFQIEFDYYTAQKVHCVRVVTKVLKVTQSREVAEQASNYKALAINYQHSSSSMAKQGRWEEWMEQDKAHRDLMRRNLKSEIEEANYNLLDQAAEDLNCEFKSHISHEKLELREASSRALHMKDSLATKTSMMKRKKFY
jgi:Mg-chelatase subunit ChlD